MSLLRRAFPELRSVLSRTHSAFPITRMSPYFEDPIFDSVQERPVNVIENKDDFVVEVEVPGFTKDKLDINVQDDMLTVSGSIESEQLDENSKTLSQEVVFDLI